MWGILEAIDCQAWLFLQWLKEKRIWCVQGPILCWIHSSKVTVAYQGTHERWSKSVLYSFWRLHFCSSKLHSSWNVLLVMSQKALIPLPDYKLRPRPDVEGVVAEFLLLTSYLCLPPSMWNPFQKASANKTKQTRKGQNMLFSVFFIYISDEVLLQNPGWNKI